MVYWCLLYFKNDDTNAPKPDGTEKKNLKDTCQRFPYFEKKKTTTKKQLPNKKNNHYNGNPPNCFKDTYNNVYIF